MENKYHFVAISGSLRKNSYNTMALKAAQKISPEHIVIEHLDISEIPFYNFDLHEGNFPSVVVDICNKIKAADAIMFFMPEYNYSVSGLLKNTIDFISRSPDKPFDMKPVGIIGASQGLLGTARAQYHMRQIMTSVSAYVMNKPEVMISEANKKFDESGNLTDDKTKEVIEKFIPSLATFSNRFK